jgi:hypothetical protein
VGISRCSEADPIRENAVSELPPPPIEEPEVERIPRRPESIRRGLTPARRRAAFAIAIAADVIQWIAFPLVMWGAISPLNDVIDVVVALLLVRLVGFHWVLLPTLAAELMPFVDLVPSWTAAVWIATRGRS